jgi:hypothetical protein
MAYIQILHPFNLIVPPTNGYSIQAERNDEIVQYEILDIYTKSNDKNFRLRVKSSTGDIKFFILYIDSSKVEAINQPLPQLDEVLQDMHDHDILKVGRTTISRVPTKEYDKFSEIVYVDLMLSGTIDKI